MSVLEIGEYAYHTDQIDPDRPSLSTSIIKKLVAASPAHARAAHPRLNPNVETKHRKDFEIGTAAHALLLSDDETAVQIIEHDDYKSKAAREARDLAVLHGRVPVLDKDWQSVQAMTTAVNEQLGRVQVSPPLFTDGRPEVAIRWEERGVLCRARLDWLRDDLTAVDDYKTTTNAEPEAWSRRMIDLGYDIQAAMYLRGVRAVFGTDAAFRFVAVEKDPPYAAAVFQVAPDLLELANRKIDFALDVWARCLRDDVWPAYPTRVCWVNARPWDEAAWFDREAREEVAA